MEIKTLSSVTGVSFNDTFESFFDVHKLSEDVECYQLHYCPYGTGSAFEDLNKIKFQSRVVILNIMDLMIDDSDNVADDELTKFCENHPEQNFIIFHFHLSLHNQLKIPNLYLETIMPTNLTGNLKHCEKKEISNKWLSLNYDTKLHKVLTVSYLLSKDYYKNGDITFNMNSSILVKHDKYRNITKIPTYKLRSDIAKGYSRFKGGDFNLLEIGGFNRKTLDYSNNYNTVLLPVYENVAVEIITGTMFFEKTPVLSEKEIQSVYAKNFPIYINGVGMAREMKKFFGIDIFEDIVDHSYDEIEDHFERLTIAIDRNEHLLDGSTNIKELWFDNQKRFEDNCKKMDSIMFDREYQKNFNHQKIKQALTHFNITVE